MAPRHLLIDDLKVGDTFSFRRTITEDDLRATIALTRDQGGYHVDERFAQAAGFRTVITPGLLQASMATKLGGDLNFLAREISFTYLKPVYVGDELEVVLRVERVEPARRLTELSGDIRNQHGEVVLKVRAAGHLPHPDWGLPVRPGA